MQPSTARWRDPLVFVGLALAMNALIFAFGWNEDGAARNALAPPGWVVGGVWVVLLALLGLAHARLRAGTGAAGVRRALLMLFLLCLGYPLYTAGLSDDRAALLGNFVVLAWAAATAVAAAAHDRVAGALLVPMLLWIGYANVIVGAALG